MSVHTTYKNKVDIKPAGYFHINYIQLKVYSEIGQSKLHVNAAVEQINLSHLAQPLAKLLTRHFRRTYQTEVSSLPTTSSPSRQHKTKLA